MDHQDEEQPLLARHDPIVESAERRARQIPRSWSIPAPIACLLLNFFMEMYDQMLVVPQLALLERAVRREYQSCKSSGVQHELAMLRSRKAFYDALPIFLTAFPIGLLADLYGRKKVLACCILASAASTLWLIFACWPGNEMPLQSIYATAFFAIFGNITSANALVYLIAADSTHESRRTQSFFYLYSIYLVCELLAPMIALVAMEVTLELPFYIALGFLTCSLPILICCPETRFDGHGKDIAPIMTADASSEPSEEQVAQQETAVMRFPRTITDHLKTSVLVFRQTGILAAFMVLFLGSLRPATVSILLQYTRVRFDWAVQNTAVLVSAVAIVNIFWFLLVAPQVLSRITATWHTPADLISKRIVLGSLLVLTLGSLVMGLATSSAAIIVAVMIFATGYGTRVSTLSLIAGWTDPSVRARVFALTTATENAGRLLAEPMLLKVLATSIDMPGHWRGLPFFTSAGGFLLGAALWLISVF